MSTIPSTSLFETLAEGLEVAKALDVNVAAILERLVAARRDLAQIDAQRDNAAQLLAKDLPLASAEAHARLERAQAELEAYLKARVEGPIP